jgi:hypothetical protein
VDLNPSLESALKAVFPNTIIIICTFHAEKLLVDALIKEFNRLARKIDGGFISGCNKLREITIRLEKEGILGDLSWIKHDVHSKWYAIYKEIQGLDKVDDPGTFTRGYEALLGAISWWKPGLALDFATRLAPYMPKRGFTMKGLKYFKPKLKTTWRAELREMRKEIMSERKEFSKGRYLMVKKPKEFSQKEKKKLREYLSAHPFMRPYRETITRFYQLFERNRKGTPSLDFLSALLQEDSHKKLKAAVKTLQSKAELIFNYRKLHEIGINWQDLRAARVNAEHVNTRLNKVARNACGLRTFESARFRAEQFLGCPVFLSPSFKASEVQVHS